MGMEENTIPVIQMPLGTDGALLGEKRKQVGGVDTAHYRRENLIFLNVGQEHGR